MYAYLLIASCHEATALVLDADHDNVTVISTQYSRDHHCVQYSFAGSEGVEIDGYVSDSQGLVFPMEDFVSLK